MWQLLLYLVICDAKPPNKEEMCRKTVEPSGSFKINSGHNMLKEGECTDILIVGAKYLFEFCAERQYKATLKMTLDGLKKERQLSDFYEQSCAKVVYTMPARDFILKMESTDECGHHLKSSCHIKACPHREPKANVSVDGGPNLLQLPVCEQLFWPQKYTLKYCIEHLTSPVHIKIKKEADVIALASSPCVTVKSHFSLGEALYSFTYEDKCTRRGAYICNFIGSHDVEKDFIDAIIRIHSPMLLLAVIPVSLIIIVAGFIRNIRANRIAGLNGDGPLENFQPFVLTSRRNSKMSGTKTIASTVITRKDPFVKGRLPVPSVAGNSRYSDFHKYAASRVDSDDSSDYAESSVDYDSSNSELIWSPDAKMNPMMMMKAMRSPSRLSEVDSQYDRTTEIQKFPGTSARSSKIVTTPPRIHTSGTKKGTQGSEVSSSWYVLR